MRFRRIKGGCEPRWQTPVRVKVARWKLETIESPADALEKLSDRWSSMRGRHYRSAVVNCKAAVSCQYSSELAREAFVRAALEAAVLSDASGSNVPEQDNDRLPALRPLHPQLPAGGASNNAAVR